jgi:putative ABC transport system permease protein
MAMGHGLLLRALLLGAFRAQPGRLVFSTLCIALGVGLGLAIATINQSAVASFGEALRTVNGQAQASIVGRGGKLRDDDFVTVALLSQVAAASPILALEHMRVFDAGGKLLGVVRVIGADFLRLGEVSPALLPRLHRAASAPEPSGGLFAADQVFVSAAAQQLLGLSPGQTAKFDDSAQAAEFVVRGDLPAADPGAAIVVMDLASAQWRLGSLGRLSQIDIKLHEGARLEALSAALPAHLLVQTPQAQVERVSNLSRAYRVNLNMLALVALLTGGFIVATSLSLLVRREQAGLALLQILGAHARLLRRYVLALGVVLGTVGALLGLLIGLGLAQALLVLSGGNLGSAFFDWRTRQIVIDPVMLMGFTALGITAGIAGAWGPARQAWSAFPSRMIKSGNDAVPSQPALLHLRPIMLAGVCSMIAAGLLATPSLNGIALGAYLAMALILGAGLMAIGPLLSFGTAKIQAIVPRLWPRYPGLWLGVQSLQFRPSLRGSALGAIVASFALACAMSIMVSSFRTSVDRWLGQVLPADLYLRSPASSNQGGLSAEQQQRITALPGIRSVEFFRSIDLIFDQTSPTVSLLARPLVRQDGTSVDLERVVPLTGRLFARPKGSDLPLVFISEAVHSLHRIEPGSRMTLTLGRKQSEVWVAGIWRDYGRPGGAIVMDQAEYARLSEDHSVSDAAIMLEPGGQAQASIEQDALLNRLERRTASELRALSLQIFDRSFVVTRLLEWAAMTVGLFGVASLLSAEALARRKEFGLLLHLGFRMSDLRRQMVIEAALQVGIGVAWGLVIGAALALVLIYRVNPQSFHWSMDFHMPWLTLFANATGLVLIASVVSAVVARRLGKLSPAQAVRQDW